MIVIFSLLFILMIIILIATAVFFIKYLVAIFKQNAEKRHKNKIITLSGLGISFVLFCFLIWFSGKIPDSKTDEADNKPKVHKVEKKKTSKPKKKKTKSKTNSRKKTKKVKKDTKKTEEKKKTKAKPKSSKKSATPKVSKAERNGKAYEKAINKLNGGTVEYAKYDYKKNVLTYVGYDDMLTWKHSEFRKTLPILEAWALKMAPKYDIYVGKLRINFVSENKTPIAHWTNVDDWQFDR